MGDKVWRKLDARQVTSVFAVLHHNLKQIQLNDPTKPDVTARTRELQRQGGSPGTGTNNGNSLGGVVVY